MLLNADHPQWLYNTSTTAVEVTASFAPRGYSSTSTADSGEQYHGPTSDAAATPEVGRTRSNTGEASNTETSTESEESKSVMLKGSSSGSGLRKRNMGRKVYRTACLLWANR